MKVLTLCLLAGCLGLGTARAQTADEVKATINYVRSLQQADGGFLASAPAREGPPAVPSLRATSAALRALKYFQGTPPDAKACERYVRGAFDRTHGGFGDRQPNPEADVVSTAVGLMAAAALGLPEQPYTAAGVEYLAANAKTFEDIRIAAAGLEAVGQRPPKAAAWLEQVVKMRNPDGSYGKGDGLARATGSAVVVVLRLGGRVEHPEKVLEVLRAGQRNDGGFGKEGAAASDLETTYRVLRAFVMLKARPDGERCRAFVARCRNADGGYGVAPGQPSSVGATYFAATIRHWLAEKE